MIRVDGRMCLEENGYLFRAKDGVLEARPIVGGAWTPLAPEPDSHPRRLGDPPRLADLLTYWDRDI